MILFVIIISPTISAENSIFKLSNELEEGSYFCPTSPQKLSVCMPPSEYRRLMKQDTIENEILRKKLELSKKKEEFKEDFSFSWKTLLISFFAGMVVEDVVD